MGILGGKNKDGTATKERVIPSLGIPSLVRRVDLGTVKSILGGKNKDGAATKEKVIPSLGIASVSKAGWFSRRVDLGTVKGILGGKNKDGAATKEKVIPSLGILSMIRRVDEDCIEDYGGNRFAVWSVRGLDSASAQVINGWLLFLNSMEYPIQIIIRQHAPDLSLVRQRFIETRPEHMRVGRINDVANSMLDFLQSLEEGGRVVARRWYVVVSASKAMEMSSILAQSGYVAERLETEELGLLLQACVSGMGYGSTEELYQVQESKNYLELNQRFMSVMEVNKWPRRISLLFLEQLLRMGEEMDISMWIWPVSQRESHTRLQMQRSRFEGARLSAIQKGKLVQPEVELAIDDVIRISDEVERGVSRLFRRTLNIAVYGRTEDDLKEIVEKVSGHFRASLSTVRPLKFRQGKGFQAMMPAVRKGTANVDLIDTGTMLRMFPFGPQDLDDREGSLLGMDLRSRTPVIYDAFNSSAMNGHMVVMARSGAGKSFFTKLRVLRESLRGIPIYLIDPEGEYGVITRALGGEVFVPGSPGFGLNPFVVGYTEEGDLTKRISSLCSLVGVMLEGEVNVDRKSIIDQCLTGFYAKELRESSPGEMLGRGGIASFYDFLQSEDANPMGGPMLAHLLAPFAVGSARFLMRGDSRNLLENEAPVTSFNLKNLAGPLKPVATSVCSEVVWGLAVTHPRPRILVVDECWTVLATPSGAEALITIVKRARKYQLGLMTITQDVQDFLAENSSGGVITGHAGRSLLQNSAMKLAFSQDPAALPQVVEALGLSDDVGQFLAGSLRGQGVLVNESGTCFPIEIVSTAKERELVMDTGWLTDGEALPVVELDEAERQMEFSEMLLERLRREREEDAALGA